MLVILEIGLLTFSAWTIIYHISLLGRFPSRPVFIFFTALLVPLFYLYLRRRRKQSRGPRFPGRDVFRFGTGVAALALAGGILALVLSRPDIDDLDFFHRAMVQVGKPNEPFTLRDTIYNLPDLPPISLPHYLSSYEMLVSFAGSLTGLGPLQAYHNLAALIVGGLVPLVYVCLYRELGVGRALSLLATAAAIAFLLLDGNTHRSFGNYGLLRCWQGKVVLAVLLTPLTLLSALRFLKAPTGWNYLVVTMCAISAPGLSSSGIFMIPILIFGISLASVAAGHVSARSLARSGILNIASIYPVILAGTFLAGIIPLPRDTSIWEHISIWPRDWWSNLRLVIGGKEALSRDLLILLILPIACLPKPKGRLIVALSLIFIIIFANPLLGPHWVSALKPGGYWRLAFLFPIPLCAGLVVCCLKRSRGAAKRTKAFRCLAAAVVILASVWAGSSTVFTPRTRFKSPFSYRFYPRELTLAIEAAGVISGRNILAPPRAAWVIGLIDPDSRFEATRPIMTGHIFRNAGMPIEGERRTAAQMLVWKGTRTAAAKEAFQKAVADGVDAIITVPRHLPLVQDLLGEDSGDWETPWNEGYYILLLKSPGLEDGEAG